jgi:hypothetical protein
MHHSRSWPLSSDSNSLNLTSGMTFQIIWGKIWSCLSTYGRAISKSMFEWEHNILELRHYIYGALGVPTMVSVICI